MNEKTKKTLSYILSILIVGSITICIVVKPRISLAVIGALVLGAFALLSLIYIVGWLIELIYNFLSSDYFQKVCRKYISKSYESRKQLLYYRGNEVCSKKNAVKIALLNIHYENIVYMMIAVIKVRMYLLKNIS